MLGPPALVSSGLHYLRVTPTLRGNSNQSTNPNISDPWKLLLQTPQCSFRPLNDIQATVYTTVAYLPGWRVALIIQGATVRGSRPLHSGAVILEDSTSVLLHSVIFYSGGLALALPPTSSIPIILQSMQATKPHSSIHSLLPTLP